MRIIVINPNQGAANLPALVARLFGNADGNDAALQQLQRLNPHVLNFQSIEPGTVLLVPDLPGLKEGESTPVGAQAFNAFRDQVSASLEAVATRVGLGYETLASEGTDFNAVLKTAAMKRVVNAEPDLKPRLDAAAKVFKKDQQQASEAQTLLKALHEGGLAELDALAKLLS